MALTSLLWISISLWPARKRERDNEQKGGCEREKPAEKEETAAPPRSSSLGPRTAAGLEGRETREKGRKTRKGRPGEVVPWICQSFLQNRVRYFRSISKLR